MEATLYDELHTLKRPLTLDLNKSSRRRFDNAPVLTSPDLHMLKLGTPELERMLIGNEKILMTPGGLFGKEEEVVKEEEAKLLFPRTVTEEQEMYARGFVEALNVLRSSENTEVREEITYTNLDTSGSSTAFSQPYIKDEPQTVPSLSNTPPMSPIDMETQERIKLERKRQRNRVAASKCRRRKLERISRLEDKVKQLKGENTELSTVVNRLKEQVCHLKEKVMEHVEAGCQIVIAPQF